MTLNIFHHDFWGLMAPGFLSLQLFIEASTLIQEQKELNPIKSSWLITSEILTVT